MKKYKKVVAGVLSVVFTFCLFPSILNNAPTVNAANYGISNPRVYDGMSTWDCVYFGNYWQSDTDGDGVADKNDEKEPIKWRVLSVEGNDAFLLAEHGLDCQPYNTERTKITWEICTLRTWLNDDFYNTAFTSDEQSAIKTTQVKNYGYNKYGTNGGNNTNDKIYLLSTAEVTNVVYGFSEDENESETRVLKNTSYARNCGASDTMIGLNNGFWWLRSPSIDLGQPANISNEMGDLGAGNAVVDKPLYSIRPAIHIDLSSSTWTKAETVNQKGEIGIEVTPDPALVTPPPTKQPTPTPNNIVVPQHTPYIINMTARPTITPTPTPTVKPNTVTAPGKVKKLKVKNNKKRTVTVSWKKVTGAKGYQIQYVTNKAFSKKKSKFVKKNKFTVKKLKKKKTYYFRVQAYKLNGKQKVYGKWSAVKKIKIKK